MEEGNTWPNVDDYIEFAENLQKRVLSLGNIQGIGKLEKKIKAELKFMQSLKRKDLHTQQSRLKSSNLGHFASLVHAAERVPGLVGVLVPYGLPSRSDSLLVDLLAAGGHAWIKIVARKAQALHLVWAGAGQFGERDLLSQAEEYAQCASRHPHHFQTPQIHFAFFNQVTQPMASALENLGICVWGERVAVDNDIHTKINALAVDDSSDDSEDDIEDGACGDTSSSGSVALTRVDRPGVSDQRTDFSNLYPSPIDVGRLCDYGTSSLQWDEHCEKSQTHTSNSKEVKTNIDRLQTHIPRFGGAYAVPNACEEDISVNQTQHTGLKLSHLSEETDSSTTSILPTERNLFLELIISPPNFQTFLTMCIPSEKNSLTYNSESSFPESSSGASLTPCEPVSTSCMATSASDNSFDNIKRVNLDITSLIALVSSVTNGRCNFRFKDDVLTLQAQEERDSPVLPVIQRFLTGKKLFACETAVSSFRSILNILGGPEENARANALLADVDIVPDHPSERTLALQCQGRVKERSKIVFGTGDSLQAITLTSNTGFVRAARSQGIVFPVFLHPARALTEEKEPQATPL